MPFSRRESLLIFPIITVLLFSKSDSSLVSLLPIGIIDRYQPKTNYIKAHWEWGQEWMFHISEDDRGELITFMLVK